MDKEIKEWIEKIKKTKKENIDLLLDEDLSIALMNLISLEEHFYFTAMKTENNKYLEFQSQVRKMRQKYLKRIVISPIGEEWCISKHLLASSMRLYEVGCKEQGKGNKKKAEEYFISGFELWSLFFAINLKIIDNKKISDDNLTKNQIQENKKQSKFSKMVSKIVDCCKEW